MDQRDSGAVGYGRPPKEYQWKKGQSGNPKGSQQRGLFDYARDHLSEAMAPVAGMKSMTALSRMYLRLCLEGIRGDRIALFDAVRLAIAHEIEAVNKQEDRYIDVEAIREELIRKLSGPDDGSGKPTPATDAEPKISVPQLSAKERRIQDRSIEREVKRIMRERKRKGLPID